MRLFTCFKYFGEHDMLRLRQMELAEFDPVLVVVEGSNDYVGRDRKPAFPYPFADNVFYHYGPFDGSDPWDRDWNAWQMLWELLGRAEPDGDDIVVLSDCDEIPSPAAIKCFERIDEPHPLFYCLQMPTFYYHLNLRCDQQIIRKPKIFRWKDADRIDMTAKDFRLMEHGPAITSGGWHFSYMWRPIADKIAAIAHTEFHDPEYTDDSKIKDRVDRMVDLFDRPYTYKLLSDWSSLPRCVQEHPEQFSHLLRVE